MFWKAGEGLYQNSEVNYRPKQQKVKGMGTKRPF